MNNRLTACALVALVAVAPVASGAPGTRPRARDLGVPFEGQPGPLDAITDVKGVAVGHSTIVRGEGKLEVGKGPVRTGVTAVVPRGRATNDDPVFAGWWTLNGAGEMTGTTWVEESGFLEGPVMLTNTHSIGAVHEGTIAWRVKQGDPDATGYWWSNPVVAETWDGELNDINGFHVKRENVFEALDKASGGPVAEGSVGGGTGMICNGFKGGIGTASRVLTAKEGGYTVGALVQCNYGRKSNLIVAGVPVGRELAGSGARDEDAGSIIVVVATDAPLVPTQLKRLARRVALGLGRDGAQGGNGSGDIFIAFSTANPGAAKPTGIASVQMLPNDRMNPLFAATIQSAEEAVINSMVAADTMTGANGFTVKALPQDELVRILKKYNRLVERKGPNGAPTGRATREP
ncbi:MAG TPA: P1 family peptidase [Thermoanaerobaculia bacterium]|jgi:L-aminopeptidase/D-esterase-like protein|nr:P1 family peptidase [Thermoanaerobaculia bacterium]